MPNKILKVGEHIGWRRIVRVFGKGPEERRLAADRSHIELNFTNERAPA